MPFTLSISTLTDVPNAQEVRWKARLLASTRTTSSGAVPLNTGELSLSGPNPFIWTVFEDGPNSMLRRTNSTVET